MDSDQRFIEPSVNIAELEKSGVKVTQGFIELNNESCLAEIAQVDPDLAIAVKQWTEL